MKIKIKDIKIGSRIRQRLGNLTSLANSMKLLGQLQPVLVSPLKTLIAGQRRIEAAKRLGWTEIEAVETDTLDNAVLKLKAERDENTERAKLVPSEMAALAKELRALEKPEAEKRKASTQFGKHGGRKKTPPANKGKTQEKLAEAVGTSASNLRKIEAVTKAAEKDPTLAPVIKEMDDTGNVNAAHRKVFPNPVLPATDNPITLSDFQTALDLLESRIPADGDHAKFGRALDKAATRQMNWGHKATGSAYV
jgi:ParB family chromosome partitioning protein